MRIRELAQSAVDGVWADVAGVTDAELAAFLEQITPIVQGARLASVEMTSGYIRRTLQLTDGISPDVADFIAEDVANGIRNGAALEEVYARPIITARTALSKGANYADAMRQGKNRLDTTVATDVQVGMRDTVYEYGRRVPQIRAWRRVLAPGKVCGLCVAASTQIYRTGALMPIHDNCDCGVIPETENFIPRDVNAKRLRDLQTNAGENYSKKTYRDHTNRRNEHHASGLKSVRGWVDDEGGIHYGNPPEDAKAVLPPTTVREHGELGPTLVDASHEFTGPDEVG
jgi:hypothetical protein